MDTATREPSGPTAAPPTSDARRFLAAAAGPALIVIAVLIALRGIAFLPRLSNQHSDILSFWLPRSCFLGRSLAQGHVPLWNPFELVGTPFAADTQSGWLALPTMLLSRIFGCGGGLRALIVLYPIAAGLGLRWFLRTEGLGRIAATAGGLSLAMAMAASTVAISLPFAATLAWTPFVLVGASRYLSASGWRRFGWLALGAIAWGQVAASHLSHGLVMCTGLTVAYLVARSIRDVRSGERTGRSAVLLTLGFLAFLPLASLAIVIPRFALIGRSSLRAGYGVLEGTLPRIAGIQDRPIPTTGVWSAWPLALASTPGAYLGAITLLAVPLAWRDRSRRYLVAGFVVAGVIAYLLTLTLFVGAGWFRALVLRLPFGDVYLHNPSRLRYLALLVVPVLGAAGIQGLLNRRPPPALVLRWLGAGMVALLIFPLLVGADPGRLVTFALGGALAIGVVWALARGRRWAPAALVGLLALELLLGALWSSAYQGGTVRYGLEGGDHPSLVWGPLRWPAVDLETYLEPGPIARALRADRESRYLAWVPPAAYFNKGYLFTQDRADWPAMLLGRALLFEVPDALGYSPIQLPRYWAYIRATNRLPVFYNASVIQLPTAENVRLLGVRYLIAHENQALPAGLDGAVVALEAGYRLYDLAGAGERISVVPAWTVVADTPTALEAVSERGFDPASLVVLETDPGVAPSPGAGPGTATAVTTHPEDVRIAVEADAPSMVLVRTAWDEGWSATVDGRAAPVFPADGFLQAVPVPAGAHEVRLTYREPSIARGLALSALVWLGFAGAMAWAAVRGRRG